MKVRHIALIVVSGICLLSWALPVTMLPGKPAVQINRIYPLAESHLIPLIIPAVILAVTVTMAAIYVFCRRAGVRIRIGQIYLVVGIVCTAAGLVSALTGLISKRMDFIFYGILGVPLIFVGRILLKHCNPMSVSHLTTWGLKVGRFLTYSFAILIISMFALLGAIFSAMVVFSRLPMGP